MANYTKTPYKKWKHGEDLSNITVKALAGSLKKHGIQAVVVRNYYGWKRLYYFCEETNKFYFIKEARL